MSEIFVNSGENSDITAGPPPQLQGLFVPGIDNPLAIDGFGIVTPWGGGGTARKYIDYGISDRISSESTQLRDLASSLIPAEGGGISFGLEGPQGLRGIQGPRGLPGIISLLGLNLPPSFQQNSNFVAALPHNIDLINQLGTAADKLVYTDTYNSFTRFIWTERYPPSSGLQETFELSDGTGASIYGTTWGMQSWTTTSAYTISAVGLYCYKFGSPGNITVSIRAVDGNGKPTGGDLCRVTVADSVISAFPTRAWYTFTFSSSYALSNATQYAIVFRATSGSGFHYFGPFGYGSSGYAGGGLATSPDSGSSWSIVSSANDLDFRIYGEGEATNKAWVAAASDSDGSHLIVAANSGRLYTSADSGATWTERQPAGAGDKAWAAVASDSDGSNLIVAEDSNRLYTSADYGVNWTERQPAGDFDLNWVIVASDADGSHLIAAIDTTRLYTSADSGATWIERRPAGDTDQNWYAAASDSDGSHLIVAANSGRLYTSADSGATWTERQPAGASDEDWYSVASDSDGSNLIVANSEGRLYTSSDGGANWTERQPAGAANKDWVSVASDGDGSGLMAGIENGRLYSSSNSGVNWLEQQPAGDADRVWREVAFSSDGLVLVVAEHGGRLYTGARSVSYSEATWSESSLTSAGRALLDDATAAAQATTLGLGTGDAVTHDTLTLSSIAAEVTDVDKFLVDSTGVIKFRTGAEVLSDIGASASAHLHDTQTLEHDAVNSDGGAFSFSTTGLVTFNQSIAAANYAAANLLTAAATNAGGLDFSAASKTLTVAESITVGAVIDDLNSLTPPASDGQFIVATGAGAFAYESTTTARTSLGVGTGDSPQLTGLTLSGLTQGSVAFAGASGVISQDNSNLFWDDTINRLGVGINSGLFPAAGMTVVGEMDVIHTATEADDHAIEIDVDAAGKGDVKAIDIDYITGDITVGEDEAIILINIDEIGATGAADVFGLEVLATEGTAKIYGMKVGVVIGPIHQDSGTFANPAIGTNDTPQTPVANMIDGDSGVGKRTNIFVLFDDYIIIGATTTFQEMEFILTTDSSGAGIKPKFEYSTGGSGFTQFFPVDGTNGFRNTGVIAWDDDDLVGHAVNADTGAANTYDIRITRKRNSLTTPPVLGFAKTAATTEYIWDESGNVNIKTLTISTIAAEGSDVDKFLVDSSGLVKYRTGTQVLSDIGGAASGHNHSGVYEPADAGLTSLAGLTYAAAAFVKMTGANTFALRTISETKTDLSLNNVSNVATSDTAYNATSWNANTDAATKNVIRDKVETMDTAIGSNTTHRGLFSGNPHSVTPTELSLVIGTDVQAHSAELDKVTDGDHDVIGSGNPHSVTPTELSLVIGTNTQAWDTGLDSLAALGYVSDSMIKITAEDTYAIRTMAEVRTDLGLVIGTNVQAYDAELASLAALSYVAASFVKMTGANTFALRTLQETSDDLEATIDHDNLLNFTANEHFLQSAITTVGTIASGTWQGTTIAVNQGGTGQTTVQAAIDALSAVSGATNEHVLTKDTGTGQATWKAAAGGGISSSNEIISFSDLIIGYAGLNSPTAFHANINGAPTATSVVYDGDSNENSILITVAARLILHNITKGNSRKVNAVNISTNTITTDSSVDDWANNDVITTESQTCTTNIDGAEWVDIDISNLISGATGLFLTGYWSDTGAAGTRECVHPYEAYNASKRLDFQTQATNIRINWLTFVPVIDDKFCYLLGATGAASCTFRITVAAYVKASS